MAPAPARTLEARVAATRPGNLSAEEGPSEIVQLRSLIDGRSLARQARFLKHAEEEHSPENVGFLLEVAALDRERGSPDLTPAKQLENAQGLFDKFIRAGADQEINLSGPNRSTFANALSAAQKASREGQVMTHALRALDDALGNVQTEIERLVVADTFKRFLIKENQSDPG